MVSSLKILLSTSSGGGEGGGGGGGGGGSAEGDRGFFIGGYTDGWNTTDDIQYLTVSTNGNAAQFGELSIGWLGMGAASNGSLGRALIFGGQTQTTGPPYSGNSYVNMIEYWTMSTLGDSLDFGDLNNNRRSLSAASNGPNDRGVSLGGQNTNKMDYVTISTTGNATFFGFLTASKRYTAAASNKRNERAVVAGGHSLTNVIEYITINSTGNATDFGDLTSARYGASGASNSVNDRMIIAGGNNTPYTSMINNIDYITISTTGNSADFGDLSHAKRYNAAADNGESNRGLIGGGNALTNVIDAVDISTLGNATDYGDLIGNRQQLSATSDAGRPA